MLCANYYYYFFLWGLWEEREIKVTLDSEVRLAAYQSEACKIRFLQVTVSGP